MKGMTTCKVCGRDFALISEEHYVAQDPQKVGAIANLVSSDRAFEFDAFDCPHCGCQNIMQGRKPVYLADDICPCDFGICDECDHAGENKDVEEHDGCNGCAHAETAESEYPCNECKMNYADLFEKGGNDE